jgi:Family of unknown function (DUF6510)
MSDLHTDGNAIAGLLREVFAIEMTSSPRTCQSCRNVHAIGSHRLFTGAGLVLRCPSCGDVAATFVELPDRYLVSLRGTWAVTR